MFELSQGPALVRIHLIIQTTWTGLASWEYSLISTFLVSISMYWKGSIVLPNACRRHAICLICAARTTRGLPVLSVPAPVPLHQFGYVNDVLSAVVWARGTDCPSWLTLDARARFLPFADVLWLQTAGPIPPPSSHSSPCTSDFGATSHKR